MKRKSFGQLMREITDLVLRVESRRAAAALERQAREWPALVDASRLREGVRMDFPADASREEAAALLGEPMAAALYDEREAEGGEVVVVTSVEWPGPRVAPDEP